MEYNVDRKQTQTQGRRNNNTRVTEHKVALLPFPRKTGAVKRMDWKTLIDEMETEDDWPKEAQCMRDMERSLRCPICHATMRAPVLLVKCGHSYCSYCIRQYLGLEKMCPLCKKPASESDIVKNITVMEVVDVFKANRKRLLELVHHLYPPRASEKRERLLENNSVQNSVDSPPSSPAKKQNSEASNSEASEESDSDFIELNCDSGFTCREVGSNHSKVQEILCECPLCGEFFAQDIIEVCVFSLFNE